MRRHRPFPIYWSAILTVARGRRCRARHGPRRGRRRGSGRRHRPPGGSGAGRTDAAGVQRTCSAAGDGTRARGQR